MVVTRVLLIWRNHFIDFMRGTGTTVTVTKKTKNYEITYLETATPDNQQKVLKALTEKIEADTAALGLE